MLKLNTSGNLKELINKYGNMRSTLMDKIKDLAIEETKEIIHEQFRDQVDPYGRAWEPDKTGTVFDPNHKIENSFRWKKTNKGILIWNTLDYAIYHQTGTDKLPQRMMLPGSTNGLSNRWKDSLFIAFSDAVHGRVKKGGTDAIQNSQSNTGDL